MSWVKLENTMPEHPKILEAGPLAAWLHVCALAYCDRNDTDGFVNAHALRRLADLKRPGSQAERLVKAGLWRRVEGGFEIHDYLGHQRSKADKQAEKDRSADRSRAYRERQRHTVTEPSRHAVTHGSREDKSREKDKSEPDGPDAPTAADRNENPEYERLADLLAELIVQNGSKGPTPSQADKWRNDVRLMVERDGRTVEQIERAVRWCQSDSFWRANVLSMGTLREKWDTMRLQAERAKQPSSPTHQRAGKVTLLGAQQHCRECEVEITNLQANNQHRLCDPCYQEHEARLTGDAA